MTENVYLLMTSSGAYDDYRTHIIGIYSSMEMAEREEVNILKLLLSFLMIIPARLIQRLQKK